MPQQLTADGTSKFVQAGDVRIHYNEAGAGHPVIMLHGSGAGATGWSNFNPNMGYLADFYRVFAVDMPGWGKSDAVTIDNRDHAAQLLAFMDALGIDKAALVGNSMGGMTALSFAVRYPDRISHLITMGPGAPGVRLFSPGDGWSEGIKVLIKGYEEPTPDTMRELVNIMTYDSSFVTDALVKQRSESALSNPAHLKNFLDGWGRWPGFITQDDLTRVQTPALLVHGRDDRVVPFEHSLALVSLIPNSRLVLFNKCGHWAQLEHAAEFNRLVHDFLSSN